MDLSPAILAAIASPRRREILRLVWREEVGAGDIHRAMPDVTFGAVSLQLRALVEAGLVEVRAEAGIAFTAPAATRSAPCGEMLEQMWDDALWRLKLRGGTRSRRAAGRAQRSRTQPRTR